MLESLETAGKWGIMLKEDRASSSHVVLIQTAWRDDSHSTNRYILFHKEQVFPAEVTQKTLTYTLIHLEYTRQI